MNNEKCEHCNGERSRCWIDYPEDENCIHVAIAKNGAMTLEEVAKRIGVSLVRISQIEKQALKKLNKRIKFDLST
tara:strand:- start:221 stop:445 length:225 start_codon:yes stop_codon:yes gene_type:complete